jgi:hypothetical protein
MKRKHERDKTYDIEISADQRINKKESEMKNKTDKEI